MRTIVVEDFEPEDLPGRQDHPRPDLLDQGVFAEGCAHCRILYPGLAPCPVCGGVARSLPARMLDEESICQIVHAAAASYDGSRARFDTLVELLFLYGPVSVTALERDGRVTLDRLRRDDGNQTGRGEADVLARLGEPAARHGDVWEYPAPGPANHFRTVTLLQFRNGHVVRQTEKQVPEPCEPPGALE